MYLAVAPAQQTAVNDKVLTIAATLVVVACGFRHCSASSPVVQLQFDLWAAQLASGLVSPAHKH
jgi:hypothetical protein